MYVRLLIFKHLCSINFFLGGWPCRYWWRRLFRVYHSSSGAAILSVISCTYAFPPSYRSQNLRRNMETVVEALMDSEGRGVKCMSSLSKLPHPAHFDSWTRI